MSISELIDSGEELTFTPDSQPVTSDTTDSFTTVTPGTCVVCGEPSATKTGKYCSVHKGTHDQRRKSGSKPKVAKSKRDLKSDLQASFAMAGLTWSMTAPKIPAEVWPQIFPDMSPEQVAQLKHPGQVLSEQAEAMAGAFAQLAEQNPTIAKWLEVASSPSGYIAVGMSVLPVVTSAHVWYTLVMPRVKTVTAQAQAATADAIA